MYTVLLSEDSKLELKLKIKNGNFLQGSFCPDRRLFLRLIATAWCLGAFVLVTSYNSLLISYVTSPITQPLINSIQDLSNLTSIHVVVTAEQGFDIALTV